MKTCVILNPRAGGIDDLETCRGAIERLPAVEIRSTSGPGGARREAERAADEGCELIVAGGGDGTINEVVNGLGERLGSTLLGILPLGTANDLARSLGLPLRLDEAVDVLLDGEDRRVDVARLRGEEERLFANVVVGGFGGRIRDRVDEERKRTWGPLAYLRSAIEELDDIDAYQVEIDDGDRTEEVYHVVIANGSRAGGNIPVAPEARLDDGLLDVVLIRQVGLPELVAFVPRILAGRHLNAAGVAHWQARRVRLRSAPRMRFSADGEDAGEDPIEIEVLPGGATLRVPAGSSGRAVG